MRRSLDPSAIAQFGNEIANGSAGRQRFNQKSSLTIASVRTFGIKRQQSQAQHRRSHFVRDDQFLLPDSRH